MKLELDFTNRIVTIKGIVTIDEVVNKVKELSISDWSIQGETMEYVPYYPIYPTYPSYEVTCSSSCGCNLNKNE